MTAFSKDTDDFLKEAWIDFGEWKHKVNSGAFFGALVGFMQTLATAVSGAIVAGALAMVGYVPDVHQTASVLKCMVILTSLLPAALFIIGYVILYYDMTDKRRKQMTEEILARKSSSGVEI